MPTNGTLHSAQLQFQKAIAEYVDALAEESLKKAVKEITQKVNDIREKEAAGSRWVYFIQGINGGPIKIGIANDAKKRLADLQRTSPVELVLRAAVEGNAQLERELHTRFEVYRLHGEWFTPSPELLEFVGLQQIEEALA